MIAKPKKKKAQTISQIRDKIDKAFNEYIRLRDGACVICGNTESLQCSHYWGKKARPAVRWDELNAHAMCAKCHFLHHHGHEAMYADFMYTKYGFSRVEGLMFVSTRSSKWTRTELDEKLNYWKGKLNEIK
jgi:hypothetical protein